MNASVTREILGNIDALSRAIFYGLTVVSLSCFAYGIWRRVQRWQLGRPRSTKVDWSHAASRFISLVLLQRALRGVRPAATCAHVALFSGFVLLLIGTTLVAIEHYAAKIMGRAPDDPLFHKGWYFAAFEITLEFAGLLLLAGTFWFMARRLRGRSSMEHHFSDWIVLGTLAFLGVSGYLLEGARILREHTPLPGISFVGYACAFLLELSGESSASVGGIHKVIWWTHGVGALALIAALPYCRLLHVIAGSVSLIMSRTELGTLQPISLEEVERTGRVGTGHIRDFDWPQLLRLDACVSCGRCQDACPAFAAGKPLSPRDVVQDLRLQLDVAHASRHPGNAPDDGPADVTLPGEVIRDETLWSCTTCHACIDVCPLGVAPMEFIIDMRRFVIGEGRFRGTAATALQKMQRSGNPWGIPAEDRFAWAEGLQVPTVHDNPDFEILYWVGCAAAFDRRIQKVARAVVQLLTAAGVNYACLGPEERCTGDSARRMGDEFLFQELASNNIKTLSQHRVRRIVTHCPHCLNSLSKDYPQFGGQYEVLHHSQFLAELVSANKLSVNAAVARRVTYHDPCYLARVNDIVDAPRQLIQLSHQNPLEELPRSGRQTACCGAGGGRMWFDDGPDQRIGRDRIDEVVATGVETVGVSCPFCLTMMQDGISATGAPIVVQDIAELLIDAMSQ